MNYVIQNYFVTKKNLYLSPKLKSLIILTSTNLIFSLFTNNLLLNKNIYRLNFFFLFLKIFKNFFYRKNILFFYKNYFKIKIKHTTKLVESCFYINLLNLYKFLNFKQIFFLNQQFLTFFYFKNLYYSHFQISILKVKQYFDKFIFFFFKYIHFLWTTLFNFFKFTNSCLKINNFFFLNFFYNTYFFPLSNI